MLSIRSGVRMSNPIDDEKILFAEYSFFTNSFWKNEEVGERRVNFFITLATAVLAGMVALMTSQHHGLTPEQVQQIGTGALSCVFIFGLITFLRMGATGAPRLASPTSRAGTCTC